MICELCKKEFKLKSLAAHVKRTHNMDNKEYYDKYLKKPEEGTCKICGKPTSFRSFTDGYKTYCCTACANKGTKTAEWFKAKGIRPKYDEAWKAKIVAKSLLKYHTTWPSKAKSVKDKEKATNMERYHCASTLSYKPFIEQRMATCERKYGGKSSQCSDTVKEKTSETFKNKFLGGHPMRDPDIVSKMRKKYSEDYAKRLSEVNCTLLEIVDNDRIKFRCNVCGNEYTDSRNFVFTDRVAFKRSPCVKCFPVHKRYSMEEKEVAEFIKDNYTGRVIENYHGIFGDKREVDIYLPDLNLAIEYDGIFYHCEGKAKNTDLLRKTEDCRAKNIKLIHIFSDEWLEKQEIVKSRLLSMLGKTEHIYARKCKLDSAVSLKESEDFLSENHLQGKCLSTYRYGLRLDGKLMALMTFGKSRFDPEELELLRFVNRKGITVIGGAGKLLKHFMSDHPEITKLTSYADRRWSSGNLYYTLGFKLASISRPAYFYFIPTNKAVRKNRINFQKSKLVAQGFSKDKSEHEIMEERGYKRIYDCGQYKFVLSR